MEICVPCRKKMVNAGSVSFFVSDGEEAYRFEGHYRQCPKCGYKIIKTACNHTGFASHTELPEKGVIFEEDEL